MVDELLTVAQAAWQTGVHPDAIWGRIEAGSLRAFKVTSAQGETYFVDPRSLTADSTEHAQLVAGDLVDPQQTSPSLIDVGQQARLEALTRILLDPVVSRLEAMSVECGRERERRERAERQIEDLGQQLSAARHAQNAHVEAATHGEEALESARSDLQRRVEEARNQVQARDAMIADLERQLQTAHEANQAQVGAHDAALTDLRRTMQAEVERRDDAIAELRLRLDDASTGQKDLSLRDARISELEGALDIARKETHDQIAAREATITDLQRRLEVTRNLAQEAITARDAVQAELQREVEQGRVAQAKLAERDAAMADLREQLERELRSTQEQITTQDATIAQLQRAVEAAHQAAHEQIRAGDNTIANLRQEIERAEQQIVELGEMVATQRDQLTRQEETARVVGQLRAEVQRLEAELQSAEQRADQRRRWWRRG